ASRRRASPRTYAITPRRRRNEQTGNVPRSWSTGQVTRPRTACYEERVDNGPPHPHTGTASLAEQLQQSTRTGRPHPKRSTRPCAEPFLHSPQHTRLTPRTPHCSSNRLVTEPSSNTSRTAEAIVGAIDNTVILSN